MLTSYLLSRTLVPTMVHYLLASEVQLYGGKLDPNDPHADPQKAKESDPRAKHPYASFAGCLAWTLRVVAPILALGVIADGVVHRTWRVWGVALAAACVLLLVAGSRYVLANGYLWRLHEKFNDRFERMRTLYGSLLTWSLEHRGLVLLLFVGMVATSGLLVSFHLIGKDFFPTVDAGQLRLHVRAPPGTRLEQTERIYATVEKAIQDDIPPYEIDTLLDIIGIPNSGINLSLSDGSLMSSADGEILISLKKGHRPSEEYQDIIARDLRERFPDLTCFFAPADIVTQVLNFGIAAPIDVQIEGSPRDAAKNYALARRIATEMAAVPGATDIRLQQVPNMPTLEMNVDRTQASYAGLTQRDVADDMLISLSGTQQQNPNFWEDLGTGVQYNVLVQTPQYAIDTINALQNQPVIPSSSLVPGQAFDPAPQILGNVARLDRGMGATNITHYNPRPTFDVLAGVRGMDLSSVASGVQNIVAKARKNLPKGTSINVRGQVQSMSESFTRPQPRPHLCHRSRLPSDGHKLPILARSVDYPDGPAGGPFGHSLDAFRYPDDDQCPLPYGRHHEHRRRHLEQHPYDHLRQRPAEGRGQRP